ncbi:FRG domain-containing protein [Desertivirga xinjiangensis]|uniref:FRG domain-containing protein n=1 Tax=Desertivirga xinjiangensis TaxID=539206 RepID=UPI00210ED9F2|nr:FRG domain-containing protein [Pedobacter xinjiangensis]
MIGEEEIVSVAEYLKVIKEYKEQTNHKGNQEGFVFRGQAGDHPLIPKIGRLKPKGDLLSTEHLLLQEFKRTNPLLIEARRPYDDWDYLTLGQHFGLPTRLLDWSNNALTALWFATDTSKQRNDSDYAVVWVLIADKDDYELNIGGYHPFEIKETKIFQPRIIKQRINNQSGVFSIQTSAEVECKTELDKTDSFSQKVLKIKLKQQVFPGIRDDLNTLGVNAFTIFPELEGLCNYLQWRYFVDE